jgi:predicted NBD/HSP70 family sugar kinase
LGLPGITKKKDGTISYSPSTGWMDLPLQKEFEEQLGLPVILDNDVNMMTLGEYYKGMGIGVSNQIYMYVGTGIGAGIILHDRLYRGSKEAAGEVGYMMVGPIQTISRGEFGVFERNYSAPAIYSRAIKDIPNLEKESSIIKQLNDQIDQDNSTAMTLLEDVYQHWVYGMVNIISLLDPDLLILSGEMANIGERGIQRIRRFLSEWVPMLPDIQFATLGEQAGVIGAAFSVLEAFPNLIGKIKS